MQDIRIDQNQQQQYIVIYQQMEINKPDCGLFKGLGRLQQKKMLNRKYFPNIRNIHQFQYTHYNPNQYKISSQSFKAFAKEQYHPKKVIKYTNQSHFTLGIGNSQNQLSQFKDHYRKHNYSVPPKLIKQNEEGTGINDYQKLTGEKVVYSTTSNQVHNPFRKMSDNQNVKYKYTRSDRFNPITGEPKPNKTFGFQDFLPEKNRSYKANNFTVMPTTEKYDIISGRRLTFV